MEIKKLELFGVRKYVQQRLVSQRVKANAQLGEDDVTPRKSFVEKELHLATIPLVGRYENN